MPSSVESSAGTAPSVLLIEEYDALAAAITSALRKFAPDHRTRTVESLCEAEAAAAQTRPQLFIVDFDPPHPNAVGFLNRICVAYPEARTLVITSGTSPGLSSERFGPNGVQFVEKPFELAVFGAAVQALLGPWTKAASGDSRGTLRDLNLRDIIPLECVGGVTAILKVAAEGERSGEIHFLDGHICHASASGLEAMDALVELLRWRKANARESERPANAPRTIHGPWQNVFLEALRKAKPSVEQPGTSSTALPVVEERETARTAPRNGKKVVVIDDTEMLSIFVEDVLSIADPSLQIVTAGTGAEGVTQAEAILPDLILLDYSLPDLRGDQVCDRLLRNEVTARIPVVIMSGHVAEMMATAERCPNVVATIAKPFMSGALVSLVKKTLAQGALSAGLEKSSAPVSPAIERSTTRVSSFATAAQPTSDTTPTQSASSSPESAKDQVKVIAPALEPIAPSSLIEIMESPPPLTTPASSQREVRPADRAPIDPPPSLSSSLRPARLASPNSTVILGLGMEVISVQVGQRFQVDTIRARPSPTTLSLTQVTGRAGESLSGSGFELGTVDLDPSGRIQTIRLKPMRRPPGSIRARNGFDINEVKLVHESASIQLTSGMSLPMTMHVAVAVTVAEVELSERFEVAQLILHSQGTRVRAILDPNSRGAGTEFETARVRLDSAARIAELVLRPVAVS